MAHDFDFPQVGAALGIAKKDLRIEFRRFYEVISMLTFSICSFALNIRIAGTRPEVVAASLWVILFFTSILAFTTSFMREAEIGTLGGLKTLPCSPMAILAGKIIYGTALLLLVECGPAAIIFLNLLLNSTATGTGIGMQFLALLFVFILGAICLAFAGSFISGLVMFSEGKTLLLSFLLIPICIPALLPSVRATKKLLSPGSTIADAMPELKLLVLFLLFVTVVMTLTFKFVLEE